MKTHESQAPENVPEPGFYLHYKHNPSVDFNNYAYEVMGVGLHTEDDCRPIDQHLVVYRPLYEAFVYKNGKMFYVRPLSMFVEDVQNDGKSFPRFTKVTDFELIKKLETLRDSMY